MTNCLWCEKEIVFQLTWESLLCLTKQHDLCHDCEQQLVLLSGKRCKKCSRINEQTICPDCLKWNEQFNNDDPLAFNLSVYAYNRRMQEMIAKWKYRGDYILVNAFKNRFITAFMKEFVKIKADAVVVPIPLSENRLLERKFNQAQALAELLPIRKKNCLTRLHTEKQAKKSREERIRSENPFKLLEPINKPVILVDDIYTTGTTIRHAASLLKEHGCPDVYGFTLIRG